MTPILGSTFTDALTRLTQAGVGAAMRAADPNVWSVRAGRDLRQIVQRDGDMLVLAYDRGG